MVRVKICGLTRREDAELAVELGAHALGFIFEPTSKRFLPSVPSWISNLPPYVTRVAVYGQAPAALPEDIFQAIQAMGFGSRDTRIQQIATVRCGPGMTVDEVIHSGEYGDAILLDAHTDGQYGGTGKTLDWSFAAEVVGASTKPVILAGGLTPENVAEAVAKVKPYAVDVSSGIELVRGVKDPEKMKTFLKAVGS